MRFSITSAALALSAIQLCAAQSVTPGCVRGTFKSTRDTIPPNWKGPVFQLKQDYPDRLPPTENYPWTKVPFTDNRLRDAAAYADAVKSYILPGNITPGREFVAQANTVRKWYNIPWMDYGPAGNEFTHGLVHEIDRQNGFLDVKQTEDVSVWAITLVNDRAAYGIGQVWCNPNEPHPERLNPTPGAANSFPEGAVVMKALFFTKGPAQVPYLDGSLQWEANLNPFAQILNPSCNNDVVFDPAKQVRCPAPQTCNLGVCFLPRKPAQVWLAQLDYAVRDSRATETGWVFGTWAYNSKWPGKTWSDRLVPLGATWGNDPGVIPAAPGRPSPQLKQTWINPKSDPCTTGVNCTGIFGVGNHIGYGGRLDGPADEKIASCLSCHMLAAFSAASYPPTGVPAGTVPLSPTLFFGLIDPNMATPRRMSWFNNVPAGVTPSPDMSVSLDYSLQLVLGIQHFYLSKASAPALKNVEIHSVRGYRVPAK